MVFIETRFQLNNTASRLSIRRGNVIPASRYDSQNYGRDVPSIIQNYRNGTKAGIQAFNYKLKNLGPGFRRDDG